MAEHPQIGALRQLRQQVEIFLGADLRRRRPERPGQARMASGMTLALALDPVDQLARAAAALHRHRGAAAQLRRDQLVPERQRPAARHVAHLQREHAADADVVVGLRDGVDLARIERMHRRHVLQRGDAGFQRLERADQHARAHLLARAWRIVRRHRVQEPRLERHRREAALEQRVVRVVMRADEARDREHVPRFHHPDARGHVEVFAHFGNALAADGDVAHRWPRLGRERIEHARAAHDQRRGHQWVSNTAWY